MDNIIIYTNLFTLKGKECSKNKYIDMYYIWLLYIIKYANLQENDICVTLVDNITYNYIKSNNLFLLLIGKIKNFNIIEYEQPDNIKQGMLERFKIYNILNIHSKYYIYLDIDVIIIQNIRNIFSKSDINSNDKIPTLFIKPEEHILGGNYYGELASEDDKNQIINMCPNMPGFTSGIFIWTSDSTNITDFFNFIIKTANESNKELYTIDQPFFNAAIFNYLFKKVGLIRFNILNNVVGHNIFTIQANSDTILLNFCGIPGDDKFHWDKILTQLCITAL
jgi:hypothetical protein